MPAMALDEFFTMYHGRTTFEN